METLHLCFPMSSYLHLLSTMLIIYDVIIEIEAACLLESEVLLRTPLSNGYSYTRDGTIPFLYEFTLIMIFMRQSNTYLDISCQEKTPTWFQFKWIQHKSVQCQFDFYFLNQMMKKKISQKFLQVKMSWAMYSGLLHICLYCPPFLYIFILSTMDWLFAVKYFIGDRTR